MLTSRRMGSNSQLQNAATNSPPLRSGAKGDGVKIVQDVLADMWFNLAKTLPRADRMGSSVRRPKPSQARRRCDGHGRRRRGQGPVVWDRRGEPERDSFPSINRAFAICDFWVLADRSRTAADCCNQLLNDAMFNVRGQFRRQDFSRPTGATKRIAFNGYEIVQYPMMV